MTVFVSRDFSPYISSILHEQGINRQSFKRTVLYPVISISPGKRNLTSGRNPAYLDVLTCNLLTAAKAI